WLHRAAVLLPLLPFGLLAPRRPPCPPLFPYTPLFRSRAGARTGQMADAGELRLRSLCPGPGGASTFGRGLSGETVRGRDGLRHCLEPAHELRGRRAAADGDEGHRPQRFGSAVLAG